MDFFSSAWELSWAVGVYVLDLRRRDNMGLMGGVL
jgi:hypothetical protein